MSNDMANLTKAKKVDGGNGWHGCVNCVADKLKRNRNLLLFCLIVTFAWGMVAHAYAFFHSSFSHDSLKEFDAALQGDGVKIQAGRVFIPCYRLFVRGDLALPWLIGCLALLYISVAVFLVAKIFKISSKLQIALIAGIFTVNITVIATAATYIHDLDCDMMAMMLAVAAVYLWEKYEKGFLLGMVSVCLSLGFYQSYISVTITLLLFCLILQLLNGEAFLDVFKKGIKSIGMLVGGGGLYYISLKVICSVTGIALSSGVYNSLDTALYMSLPELVSTALRGYVYVFKKILSVLSPYPEDFIFAIHIVMAVAAGLILLCGVSQKKVHIIEKILTLVLVALIPLAMNITYALTAGMSHDLMHYAFWLFYLFVLLLAGWTVSHFAALKPMIKRGQLVALSALLSITLWGNVQTANAAYVKKDLEQKANLSLFTRVVYRMESCEGYVTGETPVVFVGSPTSLLEHASGFESLYTMTGESNTYVIGPTLRIRYVAYFEYVLMNPAVIADSETWNAMQENDEVLDMPCYPDEGSVAIIDDVLVVKLG